MNLPVTVSLIIIIMYVALHIISFQLSKKKIAVHFFSETLSVVTFTDLLNIIIKFYDGLESNKTEALIWGRR